ncbi:MAG: hypothetical protein ACE5K2_00460 [Candidatus Zixiibacteriota bacterium]
MEEKRENDPAPNLRSSTNYPNMNLTPLVPLSTFVERGKQRER